MFVLSPGTLHWANSLSKLFHEMHIYRFRNLKQEVLDHTNLYATWEESFYCTYVKIPEYNQITLIYLLTTLPAAHPV